MNLKSIIALVLFFGGVMAWGILCADKAHRESLRQRDTESPKPTDYAPPRSGYEVTVTEFEGKRFLVFKSLDGIHAEPLQP